MKIENYRLFYERLGCLPMIKQKCGIMLSLTFILLLSGCGIKLLPSTHDEEKSSWDSFAEAKMAFDRVTVYETDIEGLKTLGFDPFSAANMQIQTYLDIMARFMPNPAIKKGDLNRGIRECIEAQNGCMAYDMSVKVYNTQRRGNVLLDLFGFKRRTNRTGWEFNSLFVINKGFVVYKLWGGKPQVRETSLKKKPLGPLQDSGKDMVGVAKAIL
jgi:hypothetical protein